MNRIRNKKRVLDGSCTLIFSAAVYRLSKDVLTCRESAIAVRLQRFLSPDDTQRRIYTHARMCNNSKITLRRIRRRRVFRDAMIEEGGVLFNRADDARETTCLASHFASEIILDLAG